MKLYNKILIVAMLVAIVFTVAAYAQQDGWKRESSSMIYDTLYISDSAGAAQGSWFVRTKFRGNSITDSVVYSRHFNPPIPFQGDLYISAREAVCNFNTGTQFAVALYHGDTAISSEYANICGQGPWTNGNWGSINWSGTFTSFDSIAIIQRYHPLTTVFVEQTTDFDAFHVKINSEWIMFYDGGELGKVEGVVFFDKDQNGSQNEGEQGLIGWKMYLETAIGEIATSSRIRETPRNDNGVTASAEGAWQSQEIVPLRGISRRDDFVASLAMTTTIDSTTTDANGYYIFPEVSRGTYTLKTENRECWVQTAPSTVETTIVVSTDTLNHTVHFGKYPTSMGYYQVQKGWNMVSLPRIVADQRKTILFPTAISNAFKYVPNIGYQVSDSLKVGVGYWLKFAGAESVMIVGDSIATSTMDVEEGWNMVGSTTVTEAVENISAIPAEMTASNFFGYDQGYQVTDSLHPVKGYWVKVDRSGQLVLGATPYSSHAELVSASRSRNQFGMTDGLRIVSTNELPPPPPDGVIASLGEAISPTEFQLEQNYPNPFNPTTIIHFVIASEAKQSHVRLVIYNLLGQEVATLVNEVKEPGSYEVNFDGSKLSNGMYFYQLRAGDKLATKKMLLVK
ncbi:MAG: T9SS type A sorting domain-containing protein [Patescibacteria group bacterium]